jgi:imidazolonepropionase
MTIDRLLIHGHLATLAQTGPAYGALVDGAIAIAAGRIAWIGPSASAPSGAAAEVVDLDGAWVTPGLIDCHTHLVFGGDRADEFERRLAGESYEAIARAGGGIAGTVAATRATPAAALEATAKARLAQLQRDGVTTVEIKSGYGLDFDNETKMLEVARALGHEPGVDVRTSCLAAHALPVERRDDRDGYLRLVCERIVPHVARLGLADAVDGFLEGIAFTADEIAQVFSAARRHGLPVKLHADQLSDGGGAALAARFMALSADHLEFASPAGVEAMAAAGTVAVLLPGAFYTLRQDKTPPVAAFRRAGVPMAVATDANPGSSPLVSLLTAMNMACTLFGLTPEEALRGTTVHAARALGLADRGMLAPGQRADLAVWAIERPAELAYWIGRRPLIRSLKDGHDVEVARQG